ncbi:unnamed protein product [Trichogramma brassicae]|uniref:Reverse transcriptase domain-containing protein n=1 Tax=Trichogramma brassicae TaxID=86971 RepID=A0A6H5J2D2_9HYME|nr:unnamed protein product [Trichogramma brassicae]
MIGIAGHACRTEDITDITSYRRLRSQIKVLLDDKKRDCIVQKLREADDCKQKWTVLRKLGPMNDQLPSSTHIFTLDSLNRHFTSISSASRPLTENAIRPLIGHIYRVILRLQTPAPCVVDLVSEKFLGLDLTNISSRVDLDGVANRLTELTLSAFDALAPLRTHTIRPRRKPWVTSEIHDLMSQRDRAYRRASNSGLRADIRSYRARRSIAKSALDTSKNNYLSRRLYVATSSRQRWSEIRRMGLSSTKNSSPLNHFSHYDLNRHFTGISSRSLPLTDDDISLVLSSPLLHDRSVFELRPASSGDLLRIIDASRSKAVGPDSISVEMVRIVSFAQIEPLASIINLSFFYSHFPSPWRRALIQGLFPSFARFQNFARGSFTISFRTMSSRTLCSVPVGWFPTRAQYSDSSPWCA